MREIEFRGLSVNGEWYYGLLAHTENSRVSPDLGWFISNSVGAPFAYQIRPETRGQFTGLKDKNGKKIFEGDILKIICDCRDDEAVFPKLKIHITQLKFNLLTMSYHLECEGGTSWAYFDHQRKHGNNNIEVIGNIYENPLLIKGEK